MLQALKHAAEKLLVLAAVTLACAHACAAQSLDVDYPTPIFSNELSGSIAPRDLGDARLTRHFYAFRATEGDLVITVESTYLFGSVDVFTAQTLRPLAKVTLYGTSTPTMVTRSVYLRREESLVLRVEGRTMTDTEALYRVRFAGSFAPAPPDSARTPPATEPTPTTSARRGQRVTATGARIDEPAEETAARDETEAVETDPAREVEPEEARPAATPEPTPTARRRSTPPRGAQRGTRTPPARRGTRGGATRRTTPAPSAEERRRDEVASARARERDESAADENESSDAEPAAPRQAAGARLVIVAKSGEVFERDMNTVRRVTVERGQIVVIGTDGRVSRYPLSSVLRMSIEP